MQQKFERKKTHKLFFGVYYNQISPMRPGTVESREQSSQLRGLFIHSRSLRCGTTSDLRAQHTTLTMLKHALDL